jgi:hypothetical protein
VNIPLFSAILQHVHAYALQLILKEKAKLPAQGKAPSPYFNCSIEESIGLPCFHKIWQRQQESGVIRLEDIHPHWYVIRPESGTYSRPTISHPLPVLNPLPVQGVKGLNPYCGAQVQAHEPRAVRWPVQKLPHLFIFSPSYNSSSFLLNKTSLEYNPFMP